MSIIADFGHKDWPVAGAAADIVERGMIVDLGTGSTVAYLLRAPAARGLLIRCPRFRWPRERAAQHAFPGQNGDERLRMHQQLASMNEGPGVKSLACLMSDP